MVFLPAALVVLGIVSLIGIDHVVVGDVNVAGNVKRNTIVELVSDKLLVCL